MKVQSTDPPAREVDDPVPADGPKTAEEGILGEFADFLKHNKKWWLTPIVAVTLLLLGAALLIPSPVRPFIYSLF